MNSERVISAGSHLEIPPERSTHPSHGSSFNVQGDGQHEQPRDQGRYACELTDVHGRPAAAGGICGENRGVVIRFPTGANP
jgi:hypothetical protein